MKNILTNKWFKFSLVLIIYLLWAYWVGSWWLLILVPVIFDIYITKKVHWAFWKKKGVEKQTKTVEWIDALIFAVVAATLIRMFFFEAYTIPTSSMEKSMLVGDYLFVSKVAYGPKLPNTPLGRSRNRCWKRSRTTSASCMLHARRRTGNTVSCPRASTTRTPSPAA